MSCLSYVFCEFDRRLRHPAAIERSGQFITRDGLDFDEVSAACGELLVTTVAFSERWFDFAADEGEPAVLIKILNEDAETLVDLAAWPMAGPDRARLMFGRPPMLGLAAAVNPSTYFPDRPLRIFRSASEWLRAGGIGCVVVDERAAARILLDAPGRLEGEDAQRAQQIWRTVDRLVDPSRFVFRIQRAA